MDNHRTGEPGQEGQTAPDTDAFVRAVTAGRKDAPPGSPLHGIPDTAVPVAAAVVAPPEVRDPAPPAEGTAEPPAAADSGDDEAQLLRAMQAHGWHMLLLAPRSKEPLSGVAWQTTKDAEVVRAHLRGGGNVGLICGAESGTMVLDFDDHEAAMEMIRELGPLPPMVKGRKGFHVYVRHLPGMPAKIMWGTKLVGDFQRGPKQYVVCPPSIHPQTGKAYTWVGDPVAELPELPAEWCAHFAESAKSHAGWLPERPDHAELLRAALGQPGAHQSRKGVKFQCPACRETRGRDRHKDNAIVFSNGWWGCAWASQQGHETEAEHRLAIGQAIGAPLDPFSTTESGDAEFFAARYGNRVRFDYRRGRWLLFDGTRWAPQTDGEVERLALESTRARYFAAAGDTARGKWAIAGEARRRQTNLLALAQKERPLADSGDEWDTDPWLLGVPNGSVDLHSCQLRPGMPEDRITMQVRAPFDPSAACPLWDRTLREIFDHDADLIAYFDRLVGYSLTGDCREEVLALCWGGGANGKGTVMNTLGWLLGDYADDLPFSALELHDRSGIPNDIAKVAGKRFVTSSETGEARRLNEARVKALTGRDPITARFLHREFFTFQPVAKFWLATNHKPVVRDTSVGFWRRIHLIPFTQSFASKPDLTLKDRLRDEAAGILARAVRGCLAWQERGLDPPDVVLRATDTYRTESMPLSRFLDECCVVQPDARATFGALFKAYVWWCANAREETRMTRPEFNATLRERFKTDADARDGKGRKVLMFVGVGVGDFRSGEAEEGDSGSEGGM